MQNATEMKCANKHAETGAATSWPTALVLNYFAQFYFQTVLDFPKRC